MLYEPKHNTHRDDIILPFRLGGEESPWEQEQRRRKEMMEQHKRQAEEYRRLMWLREHSMEVFLEQEDDTCFDPEGSISSQALYELYRSWCRERKILEYTARSFSLFLKKNRTKYNLVYSMNIPTPKGGHLRGYRGIRAKEETVLPHSEHR